MSTYALLNSGRIIAGPGSIESIKDAVTDLGARKVLIISDKGVCPGGLDRQTEGDSRNRWNYSGRYRRYAARTRCRAGQCHSCRRAGRTRRKR